MKNGFERLIAMIMMAVTAVFFCCAGTPSFAGSEDVDYHETEAEASAELREALKERKRNVTIGVAGKTDQEGLKQIIGSLINGALEHTGEPDEGDYILFQYESYKGEGRTKLSGISPVVEVEYDLTYNDNAEQAAEADKKIEEIIEELDLADKTDYEKVTAIHDYICDNVDYEEPEGDSNIRRTAYGALIEGKAVCQGYSVILYRLLLEAGIDNRIIYGEGISPDGSGPHTWNIVGLYGKYYYMDVTWDDSLRSREYFLVPADAGFEDEHIADSKYTDEDFTEHYPMADKAFDVQTEGLLLSLRGLALSITDSMKRFLSNN